MMLYKSGNNNAHCGKNNKLDYKTIRIKKLLNLILNILIIIYVEGLEKT